MTKLCPRGKAAAKRKFKVYPSAYANAYASKICAGKIKDPSGVKRKDFRGSKAEGGLMEATARLKRQGLKVGGGLRAARPASESKEQKTKNKKPPIIIKMKSGDSISLMAKGGRAGLKGGGICKKGMNRQAVGKNS